MQAGASSHEEWRRFWHTRKSKERESDCAAWKRWAGVATSDEFLCELLLAVVVVAVVVVVVVVQGGVARSGVHWLQGEP